VKAGTLIFVGMWLFAVALPAAAEVCGKNRKPIMTQFQDPVPTYHLGAVAGEELKLGPKDDVANLVLAAPKEAVSLSVIAGGEKFPMKTCQASIKGGAQLQAFEVGSNDLPRLTGIVRKTGSVKLLIQWRKKDQTGKVYIAEK
jgi:hypothetical protein